MGDCHLFQKASVLELSEINEPCDWCLLFLSREGLVSDANRERCLR